MSFFPSTLIGNNITDSIDCTIESNIVVRENKWCFKVNLQERETKVLNYLQHLSMEDNTLQTAVLLSLP